MAHFITNRVPFYGASIVQRTVQYLRAYAKVRSDRAAYVQMLKMNNRELADMGLTRDDVREALLKSLNGTGEI